MKAAGGTPTMMPLTAGLTPSTRAGVRAVGFILTLAVTALALHDSGVLGGASLDGLFNEWVYNGTEILAAALVLARAVLIRRERRAWLPLAVGIACFAAGDLYFTLVIEHMSVVPTPSPSDAGYLM